jgi:signal transduction histidine kinase
VEGYRLAYPQAPFTLALPAGEARLSGSAELFAQMLDKLVANAIEFSTGGAIEIALARDDALATLSVANTGPPLPAGMEDRLFESMVSVREGTAADPHLGLGLYIVRLLIARFHGGAARAQNRIQPQGVVVTVSVPVAAT